MILELNQPIGPGGISPAYVKNALSSTSDQQVVLYINSPGGNVVEGFEIYNTLTRSGKKIRAVIDSMCYSTATVIAMAAEEREMNEAALFMIHAPTVAVEGDARQLDSKAAALREVERTIVNIYQKRTGLSEAKIKNLMDAETYMSPATAHSYGFVTRLLKGNSTAIQNHARQMNLAPGKSSRETDELIRKMSAAAGELLFYNQAKAQRYLRRNGRDVEAAINSYQREYNRHKEQLTDRIRADASLSQPLQQGALNLLNQANLMGLSIFLQRNSQSK